jgi:predicted regulator of Ras-like GTPase activity (Roadblock/LC7/MglB family)
MVDIEKIVKEIEPFIPGLLGVIIVDEYGLPINYHLATTIEDPIVISGMLASATSLIQNILNEIGNSNFELLYTQGDKISILVGYAEGFYIGLITTPSTKIGTIFMEYKVLKQKIKDVLQSIGG